MDETSINSPVQTMSCFGLLDSESDINYPSYERFQEHESVGFMSYKRYMTYIVGV